MKVNEVKTNQQRVRKLNIKKEVLAREEELID
jgi:hypothetical protein